ncbi:hypothetical protein KFL_000420290, partial [Klebsormidium nitens]
MSINRTWRVLRERSMAQAPTKRGLNLSAGPILVLLLLLPAAHAMPTLAHSGRKLLATQQVVEEAVASTFDFLTALNTDLRNPLATVENVPCEEFQPATGAYYLTAAFDAPGDGFPLPVPARTCTFRPNRPVIITVADVLCWAVCSPFYCACCDGSVQLSTVGDDVCPIDQTITDCPVCRQAEAKGGTWAALRNSTGNFATITDLSTGETTPLEIFFVDKDSPAQTLPAHSFLSDLDLWYGPGAHEIGPSLYTGYFAYLDAGVLRSGRRYRVETVSSVYNNGDTVVYDVSWREKFLWKVLEVFAH